MTYKTTDYVITRTHYRELLNEFHTKENVIAYINETYSLCNLVGNLIIQEDV